MTTLLVADIENGALSGQTAKALSAAAALSGEVHVLVAGHAVAEAAAAAAGLSGVAKVLAADAPALAHGLAEPLAELVVSLAGPYDALVMAATTGGKNVMPRVAALLDVAQISDIVAVVDDRTFKRPIYAGNAIATVASSDAKRVITVRTASFPAAASGAGPAPVESIGFTGGNALSRFVSAQVPQSDRPDLAAARVVVSGGRAFGSKENFEALLTPIAVKLNAAIGASRAAVDAGFAPNDLQVGQTGRIVAPELYIACGISGAIQHLAGMKDSKTIVAINKDPEAPIFAIADYGLVADIFTALPELTEKL